MKIAYNPEGTVLDTTAPSANDIIFDLNALNVWARGKLMTGLVNETFPGKVPNYGTAAAGTIDNQANDWVLARNNDGTVGWYKLPANAFNNSTYSVVSTSANGLAPKLISSNTANITSTYYILASSNGSATPSWYKMPATAFANDNTTYTLSGALSGNTFQTTLTPSTGSATAATVPAMTAAKSDTNGAAGLVPAPSAGDQNKFLRGDGTWVIPTDSHYTTHLYVGASGTAAKGSTTNGNTYIKLYDNSTARESYKIAGTGRVTVTSDANGNIAINTPETIAWGSVTGKPTSFAPSAHEHSTADIKSLTGYSKATTAGDLATTDTLNAALGKLEYKADYAYDFIIATMSDTNDSNTTIDRLKEVFDILSGITETDTIQSLVGKYLPLAGGKMTGAITPTTTNTLTLGTSSLKWNNVYATTFTGNLSGNATSASKLGTADKGSATKPIYLAAGVATECNTYAGGTAVTLNGTSKAASTASFYAPTDAGTNGFILKSNGSGAPSWVNANTIAAGSVANNLVIKIKSGTTEGTSLYTYNGSAAKTLDIKQGTNITLTAGAGSLTISAVDTKNTAGSTNSTSKLYLIGATSQAASAQTYSNSSVFATNGYLYANNLWGIHEVPMTKSLSTEWVTSGIEFSSTNDYDGEGSYMIQIFNDTGMWTGYFTLRYTSNPGTNVIADEIVLHGGDSSTYGRPYLRTLNMSDNKVQLQVSYSSNLSEKTWKIKLKRII